MSDILICYLKSKNPGKNFVGPIIAGRTVLHCSGQTRIELSSGDAELE